MKIAPFFFFFTPVRLTASL